MILKKIKTFSFSTDTNPATEITLTGRFGERLDMSLTSSAGQMRISLDLDSVIRMETFLADYLLDSDEEEIVEKKYFQPTGRALAVTDGETLKMHRVFVGEDFQQGLDASDIGYEAIYQELSWKDGLNMPDAPMFIIFNLYDGTFNRYNLWRIIRACIAFQIDFVKSGGDFHKCRKMLLEDIEAFTNIDATQISRATKSVRILTKSKTYTLNSHDLSLAEPSLFDEGINCSDGSTCSRKEVLATIEHIISLEDPRKPLTDEQIQEELNKMGYVFSRRTVVKYREVLGISNSNIRKVR